jgi:hypothetical protein
MTSSAIDETPVPVADVRVTSKMLEVVLRDGRTLSVPLELVPAACPWFADGASTLASHWRLHRHPLAGSVVQLVSCFDIGMSRSTPTASIQTEPTRPGL